MLKIKTDMIDKQTQDQAWKCLPKEFRKEVKSYWSTVYDSEIMADEIEGIFSRLFGYYNLTSDAEPEEMLTYPRKDIVELYQEVQKTISQCKGTELAIQSIGIKNVLWSFFGSKCLPDEEGDSKAEPKFKVGDKVRKKKWDKDTTISYVEWHGTWHTYVYRFAEQEYGFNCHKEEDITLVSRRAKEPKFKTGDCVKISFEWGELPVGEKLVIKRLETIDCRNAYMYSIEDYGGTVIESMLDPYTEPTKEDTVCIRTESESYLRIEREELNFNDSSEETQTNDNMEDEHRNLSQETANCDKQGDNKLNLCEILKGYENMEIYSLLEGVAVIQTIDDGIITTYSLNKYGEKGEVYIDGLCMLYPSREAHLKYPLDARAAWMEWVEEQKPWTPKDNEYYWCINDMLNPVSKIFDAEDIDDKVRIETNNYFRTEELAQQAAEAVKKTLEQFHKDNQQ